ncbi:MAG: mevalonate kinase [Pseudomonadota bacterium]
MPEPVIKTSAPGSAMLMGEHAVVYGHPAIVCALDCVINVELSPRKDREINIYSDQLGKYHTDLDTISIAAPFSFVLASIEFFKAQLSNGFDLSIRTEFAHNLGLGSSAAVTVAMMAAINRLLARTITPIALLEQARTVVRRVQGMGSGADVAASVFGGMIYYHPRSLSIKQAEHFPELSLLYSGSKTPTADVVKKLADEAKKYPERYDAMYTQIATLVEKAWSAMIARDWHSLAEQMGAQQALMEKLALSNAWLDGLLLQLRQMPGILAAKLSGAGLGDCFITLGKLPDNYFPVNTAQKNAGVRQIDVRVEKQGVRYL